MIFAYADPPYMGQAKKLYGCGEIDHEVLVERLVAGYPDGWALSLSTPSLRTILPMCPPDVRVMAWVKPFAIFKPGVNPAYAWEPVIVRGGRKRGRLIPTVRDWVSCNVTLKKGLTGAKPDAFACWLFDVLGMNPLHGDALHDLFPGTGGIMKALHEWRREKNCAPSHPDDCSEFPDAEIVREGGAS